MGGGGSISGLQAKWELGSIMLYGAVSRAMSDTRDAIHS